MSDSSIPAYADTRKIFLQEGHIGGEISLQRLPRFSQSLSDDKGSVSVELHFRLSESKQRLISGELRAEVNVLCQRCLQPLAIRLADDIKLALVRDEEAAKQLTGELDPWFCEDHRLDVAELVEEQLILCMPLVSYHDSGECVSRKNYTAGVSPAEQEAASNDASDNPFAVLRSLKESDPSD